MPKSDTWPGGVGLETMTSRDSTGSCDSVVSANSAFSDDSLEHLSAEEKACLMFLEETIESLDTEEDSGLSNDEPDQLANLGNIATKLADLSASMSRSTFSSGQKHSSKESIKENTEPMQSYLVPTPLLVANSSSCSVLTPQSPQAPLEVNVVIPPLTKPRDCPGRTAEGQRGPLSYDALVYLRRSASTKKTPLCPKIDHTIDLDKHLPVTMEALYSSSDKFHSEAFLLKTGPPAVAPKPKKIPDSIAVKIEHNTSMTSDSSYTVKHATDPVVAPKPPKIPDNIFGKTQNKASVTSDSSYTVKHATDPGVEPKPQYIPNNVSTKTQNKASLTSESSFRIKHAPDPKIVRLEALQKLGLLTDQQPENETIAPLPTPKSHSSSDPTPNGYKQRSSNVNPSRSPSFCSPQAPSEPKNKLLQSSASFHHHPRHEHQSVSASHPAQSSGLKAALLERSATLDDHRNCPEPQHITPIKPVRTRPTAPPVPHKPSASVAYTVMVVPGMGADRKEALRKLGLLKS